MYVVHSISVSDKLLLEITSVIHFLCHYLHGLMTINAISTNTPTLGDNDKGQVMKRFTIVKKWDERNYR